MSNARKLFRDRADAGRLLARVLADYRDSSPIVIALPRGGVPVAYEVARELDAPLDVCVVRKIGAPFHPELGIGAVAEDGTLYVDREIMHHVGVSEAELARLIADKKSEVATRVRRLRRGAPPLDVRGRNVIVIDDGVATGGTARAVLKSLRARGAARLVFAAPLGASESLDELSSIADEIVCPYPEDLLMSVGLWYEDFGATTDEHVIELLDLARADHDRARRASSASHRVRVSVDREIRIPFDQNALSGRLVLPADALGIVLFAHGSGSSRLSTRNQFVAAELQRHGLGTLLFDLLASDDEERVDARTERLRFDIPLLASRLVLATDWVHSWNETRGLRIGYFGASTGAAAALVAATRRAAIVHAIVSRGGRPDLAGSALADVRAPTLLLVGGNDLEVLRLNRQALYELRCAAELEVVEGATHLFEEPGTLEQVAASARRWFVRHLGAPALEATA